MKTFTKPATALSEELTMAIGLIWGHLSVDQFELADQLARGCLRIWPEEEHLVLMAAYAAVELSMPLNAATLDILKKAECTDWTERVLRRAGMTADVFASAAATSGRVPGKAASRPADTA